MISPRIVIALVLALIALSFAPPVFACGADTDCRLGERTYRIRMPEGHDGKSQVGAVIFNHGYRGTAAGLMRNKRLSKTISDMGLAFVAPKSSGDDWDIPNAPSEGSNSEISFFDSLKVDLTANHFIDPEKIMVTGFSAGGMMTWNLACERGDIFAAFAPMSGTFWAPVPKECPTMPVNLIHIHGTSDKVVPMAGRAIQKTRQGDVHKALRLAVAKGDYTKWNSMGEFDGVTCQQRTAKQGNILQLCVHPGGHTFKSAWLVRAWKEFEKAGAFGG